MLNPVYILSDHTEIHPSINAIVRKTEEGVVETIELEYRQMRVLEILLLKSPAMVERDYLIETIWNNYGGADDALNQVISHLRKVLGDTNKESRIIETIVKRGYRIKEVQIVKKQEPAPEAKNRYLKWLIGAAIISILVLILLTKTKQDTHIAPKAPTDGTGKRVEATAPEHKK